MIINYYTTNKYLLTKKNWVKKILSKNNKDINMKHLYYYLKSNFFY